MVLKRLVVLLVMVVAVMVTKAVVLLLLVNSLVVMWTVLPLSLFRVLFANRFIMMVMAVVSGI